LKKLLANFNALGGILADAKTLLFFPVPRYVTTKCCHDPSHIENFGNDENEEELMDFQDHHRKLRGEGHINGTKL
jgi:hypothetical protein